MGKDLAKGSWERNGDCFWWGCLVLLWVMKGTGFARWRLYGPAHPISPAGLGSTWCLSWKLEIRGKRALQLLCSPGRPLSLGNFPKGLHSSGILAESYPELKALSSIACQGSGSWSSAPVTTVVVVNVIFVCICAGLGGIVSCAGLELRWNARRSARHEAGSEHNCQESN